MAKDRLLIGYQKLEPYGRVYHSTEEIQDLHFLGLGHWCLLSLSLYRSLQPPPATLAAGA